MTDTLQFEDEAEREFWRAVACADGSKRADALVLALRARSAKLREREEAARASPDEAGAIMRQALSEGMEQALREREAKRQRAAAHPAPDVAPGEANGSQGGGGHG